MDFYYVTRSAPCRGVIMLAKALHVRLNKKVLNLQKGEHLSPEYKQINPLQCVPTLVDGDFILWESRAIMVYLVQKYGKNDSLFPKCPKQRAIINHRLYFDMGTLFRSFTAYYYPPIFHRLPADQNLFRKVEAAFKLLELFLEGHQYAAGDSLSVADFALLATVSSFKVCGFNINEYKNVEKWYAKAKCLPGFNENWRGCMEFKEFME